MVEVYYERYSKVKEFSSYSYISYFFNKFDELERTEIITDRFENDKFICQDYEEETQQYEFSKDQKQLTPQKMIELIDGAKIV